ncbi:MAG: hypothetical protein HYX69_18715 [Planctomycetia bacterium]|nr:hypothetical protein [Planctomycetia bacterium]
MPVSFNPAADLSSFDGLETVMLAQPSGGAGVQVAEALRRHVQTREAEASDGRYTTNDLDWHLPAAALAEEPAVGTVITDGEGIRWIVLAVERDTLGTRFRCRSRNLAIHGGLDRLVKLQLATWIKGASGAAMARWQDVRNDLAARIQPEQAVTAVEHDRRLTRVTHRIFLAEEVVVDHNHRFVAETEAYHVLGYERPERIDALFVVLAERGALMDAV